MSVIPVYFMPGMAASPQIYEHFKLPEDRYSRHMMEWILPNQGESLKQYCHRLVDQIKHPKPVLIGVSFGGMIVQELADIVDSKQVIIISSAKTPAEYPRRMRLARKTGLHKLLPVKLISYAEILAKYNFGIAHKKMQLYYKYLGVNDPQYLKWAIHEIINWDREQPVRNLIHIHGDKDPIFPVKYLGEYINVKNGTHIIVVNRYRWFNEHLPQILDKQLGIY
jgi:pimeloyl-ACP methyl ester carboxylesterase